MSASSHEWTFQVRGRISKGASSPALTDFDVIVESGDCDESSPHYLEGIRAGPHHRGEEYFHKRYTTSGADREIEAPEQLSVFLRTKPGEWKPYVVKVDSSRVTRLSRTEMLIELGTVEIDPNDTIYVNDA